MSCLCFVLVCRLLRIFLDAHKVAFTLTPWTVSNLKIDEIICISNTFISGDEVKVIAVDSKNGATTYMYGAQDEVYCTFSGYLVSPIFEEIPVVGWATMYNDLNKTYRVSVV